MHIHRTLIIFCIIFIAASLATAQTHTSQRYSLLNPKIVISGGAAASANYHFHNVRIGNVFGGRAESPNYSLDAADDKIRIPPHPPTLNPLNSATNNPIQTLSGTKDANTSIWMNGAEKVPLDSFTTWSVSIMLAEGQNNINVTAKNSIGMASGPVLASILLDTTPPSAPVVIDDGANTNYTYQLHATWLSQDLQTGISEYEYAIGTSAGGADVVNWTSCGMQEAVTRTGLSLARGITYYISARSKNSVGLWSSAGSSDGITLVQSAPSITGLAPADGVLFEVEGAVPFHISAVDLEGDAMQYKIAAGGTVVSDWNIDPDFNWDTTAQAPGVRQVTVYVKDAWGNEVSSSNMEIYLSRNAPNTPE